MIPPPPPPRLVIGFNTYPLYYLDQSPISLYPLDIRCSSSSETFSLEECSGSYHDAEYTATTLNYVEIKCTMEG
jgi:hypothetical protein